MLVCRKICHPLWIKKVTIKNEDFLAADLYNQKFDLIIGIDVVLNLIGAISTGYTKTFFDKAFSHLKSGGGVVLELMTCEREIAFIEKSENGVYRTWKKFAASDPFQFGLDEISLDKERNMVWVKFFVDRQGSIKTFTNILMPFSRADILKHAAATGMRCDIQDRWNDLDDTVEQEYVAVLRSPDSDK